MAINSKKSSSDDNKKKSTKQSTPRHTIKKTAKKPLLKNHENLQTLPKTDNRLGNILYKKRMEKNITLQQASHATKIRKPYIEAIENNNFTYIIEQTNHTSIFLLQFIRIYAKYLELNAHELLEHYPLHINEVKPALPLKNYTNLQHQKGISLISPIVIIVFLVCIFGAYYMYSHFYGLKNNDISIVLPFQETSPSLPSQPTSSTNENELKKPTTNQQESTTLLPQNTIQHTPTQNTQNSSDTNTLTPNNLTTHNIENPIKNPDITETDKKQSASMYPYDFAIIALEDNIISIKNQNNTIIFEGLLAKTQSWEQPNKEDFYFLKTDNIYSLALVIEEKIYHIQYNKAEEYNWQDYILLDEDILKTKGFALWQE